MMTCDIHGPQPSVHVFEKSISLLSLRVQSLSDWSGVLTLYAGVAHYYILVDKLSLEKSGVHDLKSSEVFVENNYPICKKCVEVAFQLDWQTLYESIELYDYTGGETNIIDDIFSPDA